MTGAELLTLALQAQSLLTTGRELVALIHRQAALLQQDGRLTDEQREAIRQATQESEAEWDQRIAEARARLGE